MHCRHIRFHAVPRPSLAQVLVPFFLICTLAFLPAREARAGLPVKAAIMINMNTGSILYQKNADTRIPPASLTKIMTSYLVHDALARGEYSLGTRVRIPAQATRAGGSTMKLRTGEKVTIQNLLRGTIICSGNDAATALAIRTAGSQENFVRKMNAKAASIGMRSTRFQNPTGLPASGQMTTARDMARLCLAYLSSYPQAMSFHSLSSFEHRNRTLTTTNPFLGSRGVNGLKTGFTMDSGYNIILTTAGPARLLIVVMGGKSKTRREIAASNLLEAGLRYPGSPGKIQTLIDGNKKQLKSGKKKKNYKANAVAKKKKTPKARGTKKKQRNQNR